MSDFVIRFRFPWSAGHVKAERRIWWCFLPRFWTKPAQSGCDREGPVPRGAHRAPFLGGGGDSFSGMLRWWEAFSSGCFQKPLCLFNYRARGRARTHSWEKAARLILTTRKSTHERAPEPAEPVRQLRVDTPVVRSDRRRVSRFKGGFLSVINTFFWSHARATETLARGEGGAAGRCRSGGDGRLWVDPRRSRSAMAVDGRQLVTSL